MSSQEPLPAAAQGPGGPLLTSQATLHPSGCSETLRTSGVSLRSPAPCLRLLRNLQDLCCLLCILCPLHAGAQGPAGLVLLSLDTVSPVCCCSGTRRTCVISGLSAACSGTLTTCAVVPCMTHGPMRASAQEPVGPVVLSWDPRLPLLSDPHDL